MSSSKRIALLSSTGASVFRNVYLRDACLRNSTRLVIADRQCGAVEFAQAQAIPHRICVQRDTKGLSDEISGLLAEHGIDYCMVFFTRILHPALCGQYRRRLVNFHPSLLPACPGLHGFEDSVSSGALMIGATVHFIEPKVDTGEVILQSFVPVDPSNSDRTHLRHQIFQWQCAQLQQVFSWIDSGRVEFVGDRCRIRGADYTGRTPSVPGIDPDIVRATFQGGA